MRPELQKMLSHCGMAENIGSQTTLVCSNQQCSGPLYKGVRQSVSKKAGPPTETGSANKWLEVKKKKKKEDSFKHMQQIAPRSSFFPLPTTFFLSCGITHQEPCPDHQERPGTPVFLSGFTHTLSIPCPFPCWAIP